MSEDKLARDEAPELGPDFFERAVLARPGENVIDILDEAMAQSREQDRSTFLGGSDIAAVMGLSPWMTPLELWQFKTKRVVKEVTPEKRRIYSRGHRLEPFIREMTIEKLQDMGLDVELVAVNRRYTHPGKPYLACEIDFELLLTGTVEIGDELVILDRTHVNVDAKSVTGFARKKWGDVGTDEVPIEYAAQFMFGLGITGRDFCLVAALRSFDDVDLYWVRRDSETITAMFDKAIEFWEQHVVKDIPPDPLNFADVKRLYEKANPISDMVQVDDEELVQKVHTLKKIKAAKKDLEELEEKLVFEITKAIGDKPGLKCGDKPLCTWNNEKSTKFQQKEFAEAYPELAERFTRRGTHRVLRIKV